MKVISYTLSPLRGPYHRRMTRAEMLRRVGIIGALALLLCAVFMLTGCNQAALQPFGAASYGAPAYYPQQSVQQAERMPYTGQPQAGSYSTLPGNSQGPVYYLGGIPAY